MTILLTQQEADALLALDKHFLGNDHFEFPALGGALRIPLHSEDRREEFSLDITRGRILLEKNTFQTRARKAVILAAGLPTAVGLLRTEARTVAGIGLALGAAGTASALLSRQPALAVWGLFLTGTGALFVLALVAAWAVGAAAEAAPLLLVQGGIAGVRFDRREEDRIAEHMAQQRAQEGIVFEGGHSGGPGRKAGILAGLAPPARTHRSFRCGGSAIRRAPPDTPAHRAACGHPPPGWRGGNRRGRRRAA